MATEPAESDTTVFGKYDPVFLAHLCQPGFVCCILREMIVMNFNVRAGAAQCLSNRLLSKGSIEEESRRFRRLLFEARTGSLLRFHSWGGRSRPLTL